MPCDSEFLRATGGETESTRVASHLIFLLTKLSRETEITEEMSAAADSYYGNINKLNEWTALLCSTLRSLDKPQLNKIVYNGKNAQSRQLANWWEAHQEYDKRRERLEKDQESLKLHEKLNKAFNQLTIKEKEDLLKKHNDKFRSSP